MNSSNQKRSETLLIPVFVDVIMMAFSNKIKEFSAAYINTVQGSDENRSGKTAELSKKGNRKQRT